MYNALLVLREVSDSLSPTEQAVARQILAAPQMVSDLSIHDLAKATFCSPSTIVRLCSHIGFSGYREFRHSVVQELTIREQTKRDEQKSISQSDSLEEIVQKVTYKNIVSLEDTQQLLDTNVLQECVDKMLSARIIYLFGMGASLCAAKDAYLKFLRLNKLSIINEDWHSQLLQANNATAQDLAIVISYSGATEEVIQCMKVLKENKTPIIAITRCVNSPVSQLADLKLYTAANESIFRAGAMSSRISQLNVIDILYTAMSNRQYEKSLDQLSKTHIHKQAESEKL